MSAATPRSYSQFNKPAGSNKCQWARAETPKTRYVLFVYEIFYDISNAINNAELWGMKKFERLDFDSAANQSKACIAMRLSFNWLGTKKFRIVFYQL